MPSSTPALPVEPSTSRLRPLPIGAVTISNGFWADRQAVNARATIPHALAWMDRLGWTANFAAAQTRTEYSHRGRQFADSEVYKLIEAMSWEVARRDDPDVRARLAVLVELVAATQEPDGYLHTLFGRPWQRPRYSDFQWGHELYCFGHLIQAAIAHHRATGSARLLDVAMRLADHVCTMFGPSGLQQVCGHPQIEVALVELFRTTGDDTYLRQASVFIERRGTGTMPPFEFGAAFWQDDMPVRAAQVLRGHAVRALYLAAGAVDVAVEAGDTELFGALVSQWDATVARRTYITGGMGSHHMDEAFGEDFVLPPDRAYCETCAGVASIMWSWRLLLATGDAKYADLIERTLFNVVATSPSADGRSFFYANTLHQRVAHTPPALNDDGVVIRGGASGRQSWFEVSCCPPNLARTLASLGAYVATSDDHGVQVHQYAGGTITAAIPSGDVEITVETDYPASGSVRLTVVRAPATGLELSLRVPVWAGSAVLHTPGAVRAVAPGYAWVAGLAAGDVVLLELPLTPRRTNPDDRVDAVRGTAAFERGPEVWCLESTDLPDGWLLDEVVLADGPIVWRDGAMQVEVHRRRHGSGSDWPYGVAAAGLDERPTALTLTRYHDWAERGPSTMRIWIPAT